MKQRLIKLIAVFLAFGVVVAVSITYAWYTYTNYIGTIDAETKDLALSYTINSGDINQTDYSITNLVFFDIDNEDELPYFEKMHTVIKLDFKYKSSENLNCYIQFRSEIKTTEARVSTGTSSTTSSTGTTISSPIITSKAYVRGFISESDTLISNTEDLANKSITDYIPEPNINNQNTGYYVSQTFIKNLSSNIIEGEDSFTLYLHLFGVQEIDSASNDFLSEIYNFSIIISTREPILPTTTVTTS